MIAIQDGRIYGRNVGGCQGRLPQSLAWTPRFPQVVQDPNLDLARSQDISNTKLRLLLWQICVHLGLKLGFIKCGCRLTISIKLLINYY